MLELDPDATEASEGSPRAVQAPVRGQTIDRFVVTGMLGAGGMGVVLAAYDPDLDRKVALKLLRAGAGPDRATRLRREAQAMAKLAHANVITVYEVGTVGDQIFIAMELVEGGTLREHLRRSPRTWQNIVRLFAAAGEGLAAAHDAGLVHRDFKPDNVLVGRDGRVRVTDFGLVGAMPDDAIALAPDAPVTLTRTGSIMGTPAYMAPEQWSRTVVDARADQFSFGVALYEALYGQRPFTGATPEELITHVSAGRVAPVPARTRVPIRVHRVVLRALRVEVAERYPAMRALLDELTVDHRRRWRRGSAVVGVLGVAGLAAAFATRAADEPAPCTGLDARLAGIWDVARRHQLHAAFLGTGRPFAEDAWRGATRTLDDYTGQWVAMRVDACRATQVRGEQSAELMDLRMTCLDRRLGEVDALVDALTRGDAAVVQAAVSAASKLTELAACSDAEALRSQVQRPTRPDARARLAALDHELATVKSLYDTGQYPAGLARATATVADARALGWSPATAEALYYLAITRERSSDVNGAEQALREAIREAELGRADGTRADAYLSLVAVVSQLDRPDEAARLEADARAVVGRLGSDDQRRGNLEEYVATRHYRRGDHEQSRIHGERAVALRKRHFGPDHIQVTRALNQLGLALQGLGKHARAIETFSEAIRVAEPSLGPNHPYIAIFMQGRGGSELSIGRNDEAIRDLRRALAIQEAINGPVHGEVAAALNNLSVALTYANRLAEALAAARRTLSILEALQLPPSRLGDAHANIGMILLVQGHEAEAEAESRQAIAIFERSLGRDHLALTPPLQNLGEQYLDQGRLAEARAVLTRKVAILEAAQGKASAWLPSPLVTLARVALRERQPREAVAHLARARTIADQEAQDPAVVAELDFAQAQALWETGGDRTQARSLAVKARDAFVAAGSLHARRADAATAWLADHPLPTPTRR